MRVLKPGKAWTKEVTCTGFGNGDGGCGAVLEVEIEDLFQTSNTDMAGDTDYFTTFRCMECKLLTDILDKDVPHALRPRIAKKERT